MSLPVSMKADNSLSDQSEKSPSMMAYGRASVSPVYPVYPSSAEPPSPVSPLTPSDQFSQSPIASPRQPSRIPASYAPVEDISRLAGFPQTSHYDHELPDSLPARGPRQLSSTRPANLRLVIPPNVAEAPPPYTQHGHASNPAWGLPPRVLPPHVHMSQHRDRPRRQSGQREPHMLTLANTVHQQQSQPKGTSLWKVVVDNHGQEKTKLTRKSRIILWGIVFVLLIITTVTGIAVGASKGRKNKKVSSGGPVAISGFPSLPLGLAVIKPQGRPVVANTCVSPSSMWSCQLPPDTLFPTTPSSSDGSILPEFRFTIAAHNSSSDSRELLISIPDKAPNATDYSKLAEADKIVTDPNSGEATSYHISLTTEGSGNERSARTVTRHTRRQDGPPPRSMLPVVLRNQPLRFFNRGEKTEHFGFFMYFTKSIRVNLDDGSTPPGGLAAGAANGTDVRFERTRFRVTIWTRRRNDGDAELIDDQGRRVHSSASVNGFPYAVTITEDRLGDRGSVSYGSGLAKTVTENPDGECRCEWTNFREKVE